MKEIILDKMARKLGELPAVICRSMQRYVPDFDGHAVTSPKISRGERYKGLPYLILDYPREFGKEDVFAIRTMFWWAHDFTLHLQLSGKYKTLFQENIMRNIFAGAKHFYLCTDQDPWQHEISEPGYISVEKLGKDKAIAILQHHTFIKIALAVPLTEWNDAESKFAEAYDKLSGLFA